MTNSPSSQARRLVFPGKEQVLVESFDLGSPGPGEVKIQTQLSLMSTGTENIVFGRLFNPGTHWDNWVKYPFYPGYTSVGTVTEVGENVTTLEKGHRVAFRIGHRSHAVHEASKCYLIPESIPWEQAAWFSLAKIAFHGAQAAEYRLGDSALVIGAGPIGQMSIRWARAAGVSPIIVVDSAGNRMPMAVAGGATTTVVAPIAQAREGVTSGCGGDLPRVVIDSTGNAAVFAAALGLAAKFGRVVVLGDTGTPGQQALTSDVITRGLTIKGAHDGHTTDEWNERTIVDLFFRLVASGRFPLEGLTSHRFAPEQCAEAYDTANRERASTMGILFDWS